MDCIWNSAHADYCVVFCWRSLGSLSALWWWIYYVLLQKLHIACPEMNDREKFSSTLAMRSWNSGKDMLESRMGSTLRVSLSCPCSPASSIGTYKLSPAEQSTRSQPKSHRWPYTIQYPNFGIIAANAPELQEITSWTRQNHHPYPGRHH